MLSSTRPSKDNTAPLPPPLSPPTAQKKSSPITTSSSSPPSSHSQRHAPASTNSNPMNLNNSHSALHLPPPHLNSVHAFPEAERCAFVRFINERLEGDAQLQSTFLSLDPQQPDSVFAAVKDGLLLW